ncbi:NAD-dependent succinate-semialdehyde dehydrogenase [Sphingosinicella sp. LY1275]|uniref:NAD-dependent succinate-semialdehyde dehydrogenase n=1 Tax=Sphingosinicella sp. LY1275 TaxID=3095379 RepID=UPI002ADEE281|nr:NAD-dependent succinate-semialdehyde dehydrogenase [Sphingosinicella sp. LY1275]MEA1015745.1 NAD-dependent succinate-semialdehyde dehydrogenase [Sphingosinicella sp. LY1275]
MTRYFQSINPATGEEISRYPLMTADQIESRLEAGAVAAEAWSELSLVERSAAIARLGQVLAARRDELARLISLEMGKPITAALVEVDKCVFLCRWYAENAPALLADETADVGGDEAVIRYLPLGIVLAVMPWNFPLWQVLRAAVPVMIAGNGLVLKHADNVQGCALALEACFGEADFTPHVFNLIQADRDSVAGLLADPRIAALTVTAGVGAGSALAAEAGRHLKKSLLELGGSDPFIVLADAELEAAVATAVTARFQNCGQVCIAAKRIIVEKPIAEEFTRRFVEAAAALNVGDPLDPATQMGPMSRPRLRAEVHDQVERSCRAGARLLLGGTIPEGPGAYYLPTVLVDVPEGAPVLVEECFGPVAPIVVADDAEQAIRIANDSAFGLSAALWSGNLEQARQLARRIRTGGVFINGMSASDPRVPIGGIRHSGYGRELSHFGLKEFTNPQLVWVKGAGR